MDRNAVARSFRTDETGAITPLMLVLFLGLAIVSGAAVDFIRHEGQRASLQDALDRGVLAAASLQMASTFRTAEDVEALIDEYVSTRPLGGHDAIVAVDPAVELTLDSRSVRATAEFEMPTTVLRMAGLTDLTVATAAAAIQSEKTEVSLVLDISGSMRLDASGNEPGLGALSRMEAMRPHAKTFIDNVIGASAGEVSVNLVPYAGQVNPGQAVFDRIGGVGDWAVDATGQPVPDDAETAVARLSSPATCPEMTPADFDADTGRLAALPGPGPYRATLDFTLRPIDAATMDPGVCPSEAGRVHVHEGDPAVLKAAVDALRLHDGSAPYHGLKWGLALLDPMSNWLVRDLVAAEEVPAAFADRPLPLDDPAVVKVVMLVTDGRIGGQFEPVAPQKGTMTAAEYQIALDAWRADLSTTATRASDADALVDRTREGFDPDTEVAFGLSEIEIHFLRLCEIARLNRIEIYTVALDAPADARARLQACAGVGAGRYYEASAGRTGSVEAVFESIASEINKLRLVN